MEYGKTQEEEMKLAAEQERQPICIYCSHPLDKLIQYQSAMIVWTYDMQLKKYLKDDGDGDADRPYHYCGTCKDKCENSDWDFLDYNLIDF